MLHADALQRALTPTVPKALTRMLLDSIQAVNIPSTSSGSCTTGGLSQPCLTRNPFLNLFLPDGAVTITLKTLNPKP
jgi:hypothetical protein